MKHIAVSFFILLLGLLTMVWGLEGIVTGAMRLRRKRVTRLADPLTFWSSVAALCWAWAAYWSSPAYGACSSARRAEAYSR